MTIHRFQCLTCDGQYICPQADGMLYFHACADLPADRSNPPRRRPDGRDENVPATGMPAGAIIAEGKGVQCLTNTKLREPAWITQRKKFLLEERAKDHA